MIRLVAIVVCLFLWSGSVEAVDIDLLGSRMEIVNVDTMIIKGLYVGQQTWWVEWRWDPLSNVFTLTGNFGMESWNVHPSIPTPGYWSASAVWNNKLFVIGGGDRFDNIEVYDPASRSWDTRKHFNVGFLLRAVTVGNAIYVLSDSSSSANTFLGYDPFQDTWTSLPQPPTPQWVSELAEVDGKIYVFGGYNGTALNVVWEYNPAAKTWTNKAPMPTARYGSSTAVMNNKIYVFGGNFGNSAVEVYDPTANSWRALSPLPFRTYGWDVAAPSGNRIVVVEADKGVSALYNPETNSWETGDTILTPRGGYVTGDVLLNSVYVVGGKDAPDRLESYYPPSVPNIAIPTIAQVAGYGSSNEDLSIVDREHSHLALQTLLQTRYGQ